MTFTALTSAMVVRRGLGGDWNGIPVPSIVWFNTAVLILSSALLEKGYRTATALLGVLFLAGQVYAWSGVAIAASPGNSFFLVFTVAHALHIAGGLAALGWARPPLARLFWHFLTALWIYLLILFVFWGNR
jgi:cytochrome c oxidase subunit 3